MQHREISKSKAVLAGTLSLMVVLALWYPMTSETISTFHSLKSNSDLVHINVYALWGPLGFIGVVIYAIASPIVAFKTGLKAHKVWGSKGQTLFNCLVGIFGIIGVLFALVAYSWISKNLENTGYTYCKPLSRLSAMGRHEVYVSKPELCVKRTRE